MKALYFDCVDENKNIWQLSWLGKKEYYKVFKRLGFDPYATYPLDEVNTILDAIFEEEMHSALQEFNESVDGVISMEVYAIEEMFKSMLASNSEQYEKLKKRFV